MGAGVIFSFCWLYNLSKTSFHYRWLIIGGHASAEYHMHGCLQGETLHLHLDLVGLECAQLCNRAVTTPVTQIDLAT